MPARDPMRNVTWAEWVERIDDQAYAVVAMAEETHRGCIYAAGTFLLVESSVRPYMVRGTAVEKLRREMAARVILKAAWTRDTYANHNGMPLRGRVRDLRR